MQESCEGTYLQVTYNAHVHLLPYTRVRVCVSTETNASIKMKAGKHAQLPTQLQLPTFVTLQSTTYIWLITVGKHKFQDNNMTHKQSYSLLAKWNVDLNLRKSLLNILIELIIINGVKDF